MGMHAWVESHTIAEIMEKKEKEVLFILSYFFQTSVLASFECKLDSRPTLYGPCNVPICLSSSRDVRIRIRNKDGFMFGRVTHAHEPSNGAH